VVKNLCPASAGIGVFMMINEKLFPTVLIILDLCASLGYISGGDWRKCVYWLAAAVLTFCVTY
jgi:hypothetical protein